MGKIVIPIIVISMWATLLIVLLYGLGRAHLHLRKLPTKTFMLLPRKTVDGRWSWLRWVYAFVSRDRWDNIIDQFGIAREFREIPKYDLEMQRRWDKANANKKRKST